MIKEFIYQFYFVLYQYYYNRYQFLTYSIKFSPEGNASNVVAVCLWGWVLLVYFSVLRIIGAPVFNNYGQFIVIFATLIEVALVRTYFNTNTRYLKIYNKYLNLNLKKAKLISAAVLFFIIPYIVLIILFLIGWLQG
jgi:hypothetical protein